jgi:hypothetical protein
MNDCGLLLGKHHPIEIESPKFMLTVLRGVRGFHVVKLPPKRGIFNQCYSMDEILSEIASWREGQRGTGNRQLIVHADNRNAGTKEAIGMA